MMDSDQDEFSLPFESTDDDFRSLRDIIGAKKVEPTASNLGENVKQQTTDSLAIQMANNNDLSNKNSRQLISKQTTEASITKNEHPEANAASPKNQKKVALAKRPKISTRTAIYYPSEPNQVKIVTRTTNWAKKQLQFEKMRGSQATLSTKSENTTEAEEKLETREKAETDIVNEIAQKVIDSPVEIVSMKSECSTNTIAEPAFRKKDETEPDRKEFDIQNVEAVPVDFVSVNAEGTTGTAAEPTVKGEAETESKKETILAEKVVATPTDFVMLKTEGATIAEPAIKNKLETELDRKELDMQNVLAVHVDSVSVDSDGTTNTTAELTVREEAESESNKDTTPVEKVVAISTNSAPLKTEGATETEPANKNHTETKIIKDSIHVKNVEAVPVETVLIKSECTVDAVAEPETKQEGEAELSDRASVAEKMVSNQIVSVSTKSPIENTKEAELGKETLVGDTLEDVLTNCVPMNTEEAPDTITKLNVEEETEGKLESIAQLERNTIAHDELPLSGETTPKGCEKGNEDAVYQESQEHETMSTDPSSSDPTVGALPEPDDSGDRQELVGNSDVESQQPTEIPELVVSPPSPTEGTISESAQRLIDNILRGEDTDSDDDLVPFSINTELYRIELEAYQARGKQRDWGRLKLLFCKFFCIIVAGLLSMVVPIFLVLFIPR